MNMVIPDEGKVLWLRWALTSDGTDYEGMVIRLYGNDYTPTDASTWVSFVESNFVGYEALVLQRSEFGPVGVLGHVAYSQRDPAPAFTCTGGAPQLAYGWYLTSQDSEQVLAAQRFDTPRMMSAGATESLDPYRIGLKTLA